MIVCVCVCVFVCVFVCASVWQRMKEGVFVKLVCVCLCVMAGQRVHKCLLMYFVNGTKIHVQMHSKHLRTCVLLCNTFTLAHAVTCARWNAISKNNISQITRVNTEYLDMITQQ